MTRPKKVAATPMPNHDSPAAPSSSPADDGPRGRREPAGKQIQYMGCPLVPHDEQREPVYVEPNAKIGVKIELKGWNQTDSTPKTSLKRAVPVEVVAHDFTPDALHRLYGQFNWFCQAYVLSPTGGLQRPLTSRMLYLTPCEFDEPDYANDPRDEDDDVGTDPVPNVDAAKQEDPTLRKELRRRGEIRYEIENDDGGGRDDDGDEDDDRPGKGARSFGERDRTVRGDRNFGRGRGPSGMGGMSHGMPRRPMEEPDWMFDAGNRPVAPPPPGMMWVFGGNPMKWYHTERTAEALAAAVVPTPPPVVVAPVERSPSFFETAGGAAFITGALTALATIGAKIAEGRPAPPPPPDPMVALATLMASFNGNKGDPEKLKQLEIDAEDRRVKAAAEAEERRTRFAIEAEERRVNAAAALETARLERENAARLAANEAADKQRAHDAKLESDRRLATEAAATAAAERATAQAVANRNDLIMMAKLGLDKPAGPTPEQAQAEKNFAVVQAQLEWMKNQPKTPDTLAAFTEAKALFAKLGISVAGDKVNAGEAILDAMNSEAAKALLTGPLSVPLQMLMFKLANAVPGSTAGPQQPPQQAPVQGPPVTVQQDPAALAAEIARREQIAFEEGIRRAQLEAAQQVAAAQAQQPPPVAPHDPSQTMPAWQVVAPPPEAQVAPQWQVVEQPPAAPPMVVHETVEAMAEHPVVWEQPADVAPSPEAVPDAAVHETAPVAAPEAVVAPAEPPAPPSVDVPPAAPETPMEPAPLPVEPPREPEPPPAVVEKTGQGATEDVVPEAQA